MRSIRKHVSQNSESERAFYHWLSAFGMTIRSVLNPKSAAQAQDFRDEAEILEETIQEIDGQLISCK